MRNHQWIAACVLSLFVGVVIGAGIIHQVMPNSEVQHAMEICDQMMMKDGWTKVECSRGKIYILIGRYDDEPQSPVAMERFSTHFAECISPDGMNNHWIEWGHTCHSDPLLRDQHDLRQSWAKDCPGNDPQAICMHD